ncbi:MAG: LPS export ABC transporter periplasmic protein LptC [Candidatus Marinimicrobia bacterium]|jgi:LPS export ABC transporter protein LptC|nr:LPS export ABC transporter periplasmic protein LptC [Candidatus Neomarinimicrobiota bacterium]
MILLSSCTKESVEELPSKEGMPDQESWGVNIILTDQGMIRAKVRSGHLEKYNEKEFIMLDSSVTVDFFDSYEQHTSVLTSNKAEVNQSSNDMKAIGNVVAVSDSGISLYSETLIWESNDEKLRTKDSIMITTLEKDTLYGVGFESDSDLKNWKIINPSGVTGRDLK